MSGGSLVIAGTGLQLGGHLTAAARAWIEQSDRVFYIVADGAMAHWLRGLNPSAESLRLPVETGGRQRGEMYQAMADKIVAPLRRGENVCAVFYGHPGLLTDPGHRARELAQAEGFPVTLLPGISAEDCLFADLEIDPGETGWQSFDATDFLMYRRRFDPGSILLLYQVAMVGAPGYRIYDSRCLPVLTERLRDTYPPDHEIIVYQAAAYAICAPLIKRKRLADLERSDLSERSLLCLPPAIASKPDVVTLAKLARASADFEAASGQAGAEQT